MQKQANKTPHGLEVERNPFIAWLAMELVPERWIRITCGTLRHPRGSKIMILNRRPSITSERHNYAEYIVFTEVR